MFGVQLHVHSGVVWSAHLATFRKCSLITLENTGVLAYVFFFGANVHHIALLNNL